MATATTQSVQVAKQRRLEVDNCAYLAGSVHFSEPVSVFDPPRPITDAKGSRSNDELEKLAAKRQPPESWYEGEEEQLF